MRWRALAAGLLLAGGLQGCAGDPYGPKQTGGALLGAAGGGLLGSALSDDYSGRTRSIATALGAVGGLLAGGSAGPSLDRADRLWAGQGQAYQPRHQTPSLGYRRPPPAAYYAPPPAPYGYGGGVGAYYPPPPAYAYPSYPY